MASDELKNQNVRSAFVFGGSKRLAAGVRDSIKEDVEAEFLQRMIKAGWFGRLRLRRQMRAEIRRRAATEIAEQMPSREALW